MDQTVFAGIGNIYSDEILWLAGIHPMKPVSALTQEEMKTIFTSTKKILKKAIEARGTSDSDYRDPYGKGRVSRNAFRLRTGRRKVPKERRRR